MDWIMINKDVMWRRHYVNNDGIATMTESSGFLEGAVVMVSWQSISYLEMDAKAMV